MKKVFALVYGFFKESNITMVMISLVINMKNFIKAKFGYLYDADESCVEKTNVEITCTNLNLSIVDMGDR